MYRRFWKRGFDFTATLAGLFLMALPMVVVAIVIKLTMGSPVLFSQIRVGRYGEEFHVRKFRTMAVREADDNFITVADDARVTRVGRYLRLWELDELPQLWNVLVGEMSLVGPRPDVPGYANKLRGDNRRVLLLRPGITGPATLAYRNEERILAQTSDPTRYNDEIIYPDKVRINLEYLERCSFVGDMYYIWKTIVH